MHIFGIFSYFVLRVYDLVQCFCVVMVKVDRVVVRAFDLRLVLFEFVSGSLEESTSIEGLKM